MPAYGFQPKAGFLFVGYHLHSSVPWQQDEFVWED
jgi:hypothetical protein